MEEAPHERGQRSEGRDVCRTVEGRGERDEKENRCQVGASIYRIYRPKN